MAGLVAGLVAGLASLHFVTFRYDSLHYDPLRFVTNGLKWFEMY